MRGSDRHSPRIDEQLKHDTASIVQGASGETRVEEHREQEGPGEGEPDAGDRARPDAFDPHDHLDEETVRMRADLARHLGRDAFPGDRERLMASAFELHAPDWVVDCLEQLPAGDDYENVEQVWEALGGPPDPPRS